jgi:hypothetical protein
MFIKPFKISHMLIQTKTKKKKKTLIIYFKRERERKKIKRNSFDLIYFD